MPQFVLRRREYPFGRNSTEPLRKRRLRILEQLEDRRMLATLTVNTTADGFFGCEEFGLCSLRDAIGFANQLEGPDDIRFALDSTDDGFTDIDGDSTLPDADADGDVYVFRFDEPLPFITDNGLTIDGLSQAGLGDTNPNGPEIVLDGESGSGNFEGLRILSDGNEVNGLAFQRFGISQENDAAIVVRGSNNLITGNFIGTDATGTFIAANGSGIEVNGTTVESEVVENNTIQGNVLSGNLDNGVRIVNSDMNVIVGNSIGASSSGAAVLPNGNDGVLLVNSSDNVIDGNTISFNGGNGIAIPTPNLPSDGNVITGNTIFGNIDLGIDLAAPESGVDGVTDNDLHDLDAGANRLQNFPEIDFVIGGTSTRVGGQLLTIPLMSYSIEFFVNDAGTADSSGHGEAQRFLGNTVVTTDALGRAEFDITFPAATDLGDTITATATGDDGTSEFSQNVAAGETIELRGRIFEDIDGLGFGDDDQQLPNIDVELLVDDGDNVLDVDDLLVGAVTTLPDGSYSFSDLVPGRYFVRQRTPSGFTQTAGGNGGNTHFTIDLAAGDDIRDGFDFALFARGTISGTVVADGNPITPLPNRTVTLFTDNGDDEFNPAQDAATFVTTDALGDYRFANLRPGLYFITHTLAANETQTFGGDDGESFYTISLDGSDFVISEDNDFGLFATATLAGRITEDLTGDGFSNDDLALEDVTVSLFRESIEGDGVFNGDESFVSEIQTDIDGRYSFSINDSGRFYVVQTLPNGFVQTDGPDGNENFYSVLVLSGGSRDDLDFANLGRADIRGMIFEDELGDGAGEPNSPRSDATVELFTDDGDLVFNAATDVMLASITSEDDGSYEFVDLSSGLYFIRYLELQNVIQTGGGDDFPNDPTYGVQLSGGVDSVGNDFFVFAPAIISGTFFEDTNGLGQVGDFVPRVGDTTVLRDNGDGILDNNDETVESGQTNSDGTYSFDILQPGTYFVSVEGGGRSTFGGNLGNQFYTIEVRSGETFPNNDFAEFFPGEISGQVTFDTLGTGVSSGIPIVGATVELRLDDGDDQLGAADQLVDTLSTSDDGRYVFDDLDAGRYFVSYLVPPNEVVVIGDSTLVVDVVSSTVAVNRDFLGFETISIGGQKFDDRLGDGLSTDDTPLQGITIQLFADDGDGVLDRSLDTTIDQQVTGADGTYLFEAIGPNVADATARSYHVAEAPGDYLQTDGGNNDSSLYSFVPNSGVDQVDFDFANFLLGSISGTTFQDRTGDGITADDIILQDVTVRLIRDNGDGQFDVSDTEIQSVQTNINGDYSFGDLGPGLYFVEHVVPDGFVGTLNGPDSLDRYSIVLTSGSDEVDIDFASAELARVSGNVFDDADRDRVRGDEEDGTPNWTVNLIDVDGQVVATTTTDSNGDYQFEDITPGDYVVQLVRREGWEPTSPIGRLQDNSPLGTGETETHGNIAGFVQVGDVNGDGAVDLLAANDFLNAADQSSSIAIMLNDGNGRFVEPLDNRDCNLETGESCQLMLPGNTRPQEIAAFDLDGDGDLDLVVSASGITDQSAAINSVLVFENLGSGSFGEPSEFPSVGGPLSLAIGDATGDGLADIFVSGFHAGEVAMLENQGGLEFGAPLSLYLGWEPVDIDLGDVNGDELLDLAIADHGSGEVTILFGEEGGTFGEEQRISDLQEPAAVLIHDFDNDGTVELAIAEYDANVISIWSNNDAGFTLLESNSVGGRPRSLAVADINGDELDDLVTSNSSDGSISLLINQGSGLFAAQFPFQTASVNNAAGVSPQNVVVADVDSDGDVDVITSHFVGGIAVSENKLGQFEVSLQFESVASRLDFGNTLVGIERGNVLSSIPMMNKRDELDVDNDGVITPLDVLLVINDLNKNGSRSVEDIDLAANEFYLDVSGDNVVSPQDALMIVNYLNDMLFNASAALEGEAAQEESTQESEESDASDESSVLEAESLVQPAHQSESLSGTAQTDSTIPDYDEVDSEEDIAPSDADEFFKSLSNL